MKIVEALLDSGEPMAHQLGVSHLLQLENLVWECLTVEGLRKDQLIRIEEAFEPIRIRPSMLVQSVAELESFIDEFKDAKMLGFLSRLWDAGYSEYDILEALFDGYLSGKAGAFLIDNYRERVVVPLSEGWVPFSRATIRLEALSGGVESESMWGAEAVLHGVMGNSKAAIYAVAKIRFVRAAIQLERWKMDRGSYPKDLEQLIPDFSPKLPLDPTLDGEIRYRRDSKNGRYLLWAAGFDGEDDNGKMIISFSGEDASPGLWSSDYTGDWVWHYPPAE